MKKRKRHNYAWDKERLDKLNYSKGSIIRKLFEDDEYIDVGDEPCKIKTTNFYSNYTINLPTETI